VVTWLALVKKLIQVSPDLERHDVVAEIRMRGERCEVSWSAGAGALRDLVEAGVWYGGRRLRPRDGRAFYDAIGLAFSTSTLIYVRDE
jgi:hypothetical protein